MNIPASDSFAQPGKVDFLLKLTGRGWLFSGTWKKRYCVLDGTKLYFYENQHSKGQEKSSGVISLDYYDVCEECNSSDKKNPYVFIVATSVRGFFDNRHQFAAESEEKMRSWMEAIQDAVTEARANRRKAGRKRHQEGKSPNLSSSSQESTSPESTDCLVSANKNRAKGPQGRRPPQRKTMMPTTGSPEQYDVKQRSFSLSSPEVNYEDDLPSAGKWPSMSLEKLQRERNDFQTEDEQQKSTSTADLQHDPQSRIYQKRGLGKLGGQQHAALTKELEMRLKIGPKKAESGYHTEGDHNESNKITCDAHSKEIDILSAKIHDTEHSLKALEERLNWLSMKESNSRQCSTEKVDEMLNEMTSILKEYKEVSQECKEVSKECKEALSSAEEARTEYQQLVKECRELLESLQSVSLPTS